MKSKRAIPAQMQPVVMPVCPDCSELLRCKSLRPPDIRWDQYPDWYRNGGNCPTCGAGFECEFGNRKISRSDACTNCEFRYMADGETCHGCQNPSA